MTANHRETLMPPRNKMKILAVAAAAALAFSANTQSETFLNKDKVLPMDEGLWSYQGNLFECNLTLPMKELGALEIDHAAGSSLQMVYLPVEKQSSSPSIAWSSAPWHQDAQGHYNQLKDEEDHFSLWSDKTKKLMHAMDEGGWLVFISGEKSYKVPSLGWSIHSPEFRQCVSQLLPLSKDQIRDQVIYYELGQRGLNLDQLNHVRDIARTVVSTPNVSRILIDSFTDNTGSRLTNLQISRERSADVVAALVAAGVPRDIMEVRSHGERYPSTDNSTPRSRDKSRKVTIRVINEFEESYRK